MFEVMTANNSQHITLSDRYGLAPIEALVIGHGTKAIAHAVFGYAHRHNMPPQAIQYAVRPCRKGEV